MAGYTDMLNNFLPFLVLIGIWLYFMLKARARLLKPKGTIELTVLEPAKESTSRPWSRYLLLLVVLMTVIKEANSGNLHQVLLNWLPFGLLIVIWFFFLGMYPNPKQVADVWIIEGLDEREFECFVDKALAQANLFPERSMTGYTFDLSTHLRLHYLSGDGLIGQLLWQPLGVSTSFVEFRHRLEELLREKASRVSRLHNQSLS